MTCQIPNGPESAPGRPLLSRRRPLVQVDVHTSQELTLSLGITPSIRLEPSAPHGQRHTWSAADTEFIVARVR
jgi:hypothetical protein